MEMNLGSMGSRVRNFFAELKRRKVYRVAGVYVIVGAVVVGAANDILPRLHLPEWTVTLVVIFTLAGLPIALVLAWAYELRPEYPVPSASRSVYPSPLGTENEIVEATPAAPGTSLVVLPFDNLSTNPENEFFSDGLTEELIADLSGVRALRVISRTSAMMFKDTKKDVRAIAQDLNVQYVLEGSVRREGSALRITVQLIDAPRDEQIWAEKYSGMLGDVFDLQEKLSRRIVERLSLSLSPEEHRGLTERQFTDFGAFERYLHARREMYSFTTDGLKNALELTQEGLEITGPNPVLYATMAQTYFHFWDVGVRTDDEIIQLADDWAARALEMDPHSPYALLVHGLLAWKRGDMLAAMRDLHGAVSSGGDGEAHAWLAYICFQVGDNAGLDSAAQQAISLDPLLWLARVAHAASALMHGDFAAAASRMGDAPDEAKADPIANLWHGIFLGYAGREQDASDLFLEIAESDAGLVPKIGALLAAAAQGDVHAFTRNLEAYPEVVLAAHKDKEISWWLADAFSRLGQIEDGMKWLESALRLGFINYTFWTRINPAVAALRGEAAFHHLLEEARSWNAPLR